jgi:hypothetical protein
MANANSHLLGYTPRVEERDTIEIIEVEQPVSDPEIELAVAETVEPEAPEEPANPDSWLQWALIIGLLVLFLVCAILILIGWSNR